MSTVIDRITARAEQADKHILLPEPTDPRVIQAARQVIDHRYARLTLLGPEADIRSTAEQAGADLDGIDLLDPLDDTDRERYIDAMYEKRKAKGMTRDEAADILSNTVYHAAYMVGAGRADGMVAGSLCPTATTCRAALFGVGLEEGNKTLSSCSIMDTVVPEFGVDGAVIFADTGVLPEPTVDQLADIGILAAKNCRALLDTEPYVAMLSFSTKGSAHSPAVQKVIDATSQIQHRRPDLNVDGELQVDAAMVAAVGQKKSPGSPVAGKANTLVFPDLSCGNIAYKLVERFGNATALGPLLMGAAKPVNDLSRGCSVEDIVLVTAITAVQALA